jgi:hypothetical protein
MTRLTSGGNARSGVNSAHCARRSFTIAGNVRQLDAVARRLLPRLGAPVPLLPGADVLAFVDVDSMQKRVYGHAKAGAGFGHTKIQGAPGRPCG